MPVRSPLATLLTLGTLACTQGPHHQEPSTGDDLGGPSFDGYATTAPSDLPAMGAVERLTGLGAPILGSLAATQDGVVYVGTDHGVYRLSSANGPVEAFAPERFEGRFVSAMAEFDDHLWVSVGNHGYDAGGELVRTDDDGQSWTKVSSGSDELYAGLWGDRFVTGQDRLALQTWTGAAEWSEATQAWSVFSGALSEGLDIVPGNVAFDDDTLVLEDAYGSGVYTQDPNTGTWSRIGTLNAWGYTDFLFEGGLAFTANSNEVYQRDEAGQWSLVAADPQAYEFGLDLLRDGDATFLAGANELRRLDPDGTLTLIDTQDGTGPVACLGRTGESLWWMGPELRVSTDRGETWAPVELPVSVGLQLGVGGGVILAASTTGSAYSYDVFEAHPDTTSFEASPSLWDAGESWMTATSTDRWAASASTVTRVPFDGEPSTIAAPPNFGTNVGQALLETAGDDVFYVALGVPDDPGHGPIALWRLDGDGWTQVGAGLPGTLGEDDGELAWMMQVVTAWAFVDDTIFANISHAGTYRSTDAGETFTLVDGLQLRAMARCGERLLALQTDQSWLESVDGGASFSPIEPTGLPAGATSIVGFADRCVVSTASHDGSPTLHTATDGLAFEPLDASFAEPVVALAADDTTLAISTSTYGVFRILDAD